MAIMTIKQVCRTCGETAEYKYNQEFFIYGPKEVIIKYESCLKCCEALEPKFDSIEEALVLMILGGRGLPAMQRKWFAYNTPLPFIDSDKEAMDVADELVWIRWQPRERYGR